MAIGESDLRESMRKKRTSYRARVTQPASVGEGGLRYGLPHHSTIENLQMKDRLISIADHFFFFDSSIAQYLATLQLQIGDRVHFRNLLAAAREKLGSEQAAKGDDIWLGDLGNYCDYIALPPQVRENPPPKYQNLVSSDSSDFAVYLQDVIEVHFWESILLLGRDQRDPADPWLRQLILRSIFSVIVDVEVEIHRINQLPDVTAVEHEQLHPVMKGIEKRLECLRDVRMRARIGGGFDAVYKEKLLGSLLSKAPKKESGTEVFTDPVKLKDPAKLEDSTKLEDSAKLEDPAKLESTGDMVICLLPLFIILAFGLFYL
ncbi:hypothetical protein PG984_005470 [Apiospora sp. TS-2023a]